MCFSLLVEDSHSLFGGIEQDKAAVLAPLSFASD